MLPSKQAASSLFLWHKHARLISLRVLRVAAAATHPLPRPAPQGPI